MSVRAPTFTNEWDVKKQVQKMLDKHKWFWWMPPANGFGKSGVSDFNALKDGVFLVIETKFGTRKPTAMQIGYLNSIRAEGGFAFLVNERTLSALETWLASFAQSVAAVQDKSMPSDEDGAAMINAIALLTDYPQT